MSSKILAILGDANAGKATLAGHMLFACGANLADIERIEKNQVNNYRGITNLYRQEGKTMSFYAPTSQYTVTHEPSGKAHIALWVVDASAEDQGRSSSQQLQGLLSSGQLQVEEQLIIVANKMDLSNWAEGAFASIVHSFSEVTLTHPKISIVPISGLHGDNLIQNSDKTAQLQAVVATGAENPAVVTAEPLILLL